MIALEPGHFLGHWALGVGLNDTQPGREAVDAMQQAHALSGGIPFTLGFLGLVSGAAGLRDDVLRLREQADRMAAAGYVPPSTFMFCAIGLDDWDSAFEWMDRAIERTGPDHHADQELPVPRPRARRRPFPGAAEEDALGIAGARDSGFGTRAACVSR